MSEKIKAILLSSGWEKWVNLPIENTLEDQSFFQAYSPENFMRQTLTNEGGLFRKKIKTKIADSYDKHKFYPVEFTVIVAVDTGFSNRQFMVFIETPKLGNTTGMVERRLIYSCADSGYAEKNIEKILSEVVKADFFYEVRATERHYNGGLRVCITDVFYPTIDPLANIILN